MDQRFTETDRKNRKRINKLKRTKKNAETNKKIKETGQQIENILRF